MRPSNAASKKRLTSNGVKKGSWNVSWKYVESDIFVVVTVFDRRPACAFIAWNGR